MKTSNLDREIRARLERFAAELSKLVKISALEAVQEALGSTLRAASSAPRAVSAKGKRGPGRPPKSAGKRAKGGKRSPEAVLKTAESVLAYVKAHPGQRLEEIGRGLKVATKELKLPIQKLFDNKSIASKGQKRGTKYFAR